MSAIICETLLDNPLAVDEFGIDLLNAGGGNKHVLVSERESQIRCVQRAQRRIYGYHPSPSSGGKYILGAKEAYQEVGAVLIMG